MSEVQEFYDAFSDKQSQTGINHRHLSIQRWLEKFGLKRNSTVLEIGCGIGTQTEMTLRFLDSGHITALDISPKSIEIARLRLSKYSNKTLLAGDVIEMNLEGQFDVILLPDVLEHIPIDQHAQLFSKLDQLLLPEGFVLVHIPDPDSLRWLQIHKSEELQVIDQAIDTIVLLQNLSSTSLKLEYLESYSIFSEDPDYQVLLLRKSTDKRNYKKREEFLNDSFRRRVQKKLKYFLRGNK